MKKIGTFLETLGTKVIFLIAFGMFGILTYWSTKYIHTYDRSYTSERIIEAVDTVGANILPFLLVLLVLYLLQKLLLRGTVEHQNRRVLFFLIVDMLAVGIFGIIWVSGCHIKPGDDQYQVYLTAVDFSKGIFTEMEAYFYMYTQQYGLAFLYECVLWIWESYHLIQYINVVLLVMTLFFGFKVSEILFESPRVSFYTIVVMNLFLPLTIYVNFVYGEVGAVAMSLCSIWGVLKWMKSGKHRFGVLAVAGMVFALMVRMNMIIVTIALLIVLLIFALRERNWKACILALLLVAAPLTVIEAVEWSYELRSGLEVGDGMPAVLHIAMGMQESWNGAGVYNAYNNSTFWNVAGGDSKLAAEIGREYIRGRVQEFANDLPAARFFYQSKIRQQWNEGSFGSLIMTADFEAAPFALGQAVYGGELTEPVFTWMERYLFMIYFTVLLYAFYGLVHIKEVRKTVPVLIAIGGMIFSLLWENKARYVFPYIVMLLPGVAMGFHLCQAFVEYTLIKIRGKLHG